VKDILAKLKTVIREGMGDIRAVHVLPDPDFLPASTLFPCVGLLDGDSTFSEGMDRTEDENGSVLIYIYVQILREEASVMGDGATKGVLDLCEGLRGLLNWSTLDGLVQRFYCPEALGSEMMQKDERIFLQRKGLRFNYVR
jgi:hypothetical protein